MLPELIATDSAFLDRLSSCGLLSFATLRFVDWDMISHKSTDAILQTISDYSYPSKLCLYLSLFPSTVSMLTVLRRRRTKKYLRYNRLRIPPRLTFRACLGHRP